jgi:hypothetical protein
MDDHIADKDSASLGESNVEEPSQERKDIFDKVS